MLSSGSSLISWGGGGGGGGGVVDTCGGATVHQQQHEDMHRNMYQQLLRCSRPANEPRQLERICSYARIQRPCSEA